MTSCNDDLIIVDFGVAGIMDSKGQVQYSQTIGGNTLHLSPEVLCAKIEERNLPCSLQHSWELGMIMFQMFCKGNIPFENYGSAFSFSETSLNMSCVPFEFRDLLSTLLCPEKERLTILEANNIRRKIGNKTW